MHADDTGMAERGEDESKQKHEHYIGNVSGR
jgi:hypothetical protein